LLSNVYLSEVDRMLEKAKEVTREERYERVEYARFADDLVVLVDGHPRHDRLFGQVTSRLREELAKLEVEVNEERSRTVDLRKGESFGFLGFDIRLVRSRTGRWRALRTPKAKKRTELTPQGSLPLPPLAAGGSRDRTDQLDLAGVGQLLCPRERQSMLLLRPRLDREEGSATSGAQQQTRRLRLEEVE
jgi:RNA-directed DNA polymerase